MQAGRRSEALESLQVAVDASDRSAFSLGALGHAHAVNVEDRIATDLLEELTMLHERSKDASICIALILVGLSRNDEALDWLDRTCDQRSPWMIAARADPRFHQLRGYDRYDAIIRRMKLTR